MNPEKPVSLDASIADSVAAAFDEAAARDTAPEPAPEPTPAPTEAAPVEPETTQEREARVRDEQGRFARRSTDIKKPPEVKTKAPPEAPATAGGGTSPPPGETPPAEPVSTPEAVKAPQSWKPAAREEWAKVPPSVQAEVMRREKETAQVLQEAAEARKFHSTFREQLAPYAHMFGPDAVQGVAVMARDIHALTNARGPQQAAMVAQMIRALNVDIEALDHALSGEAPRTQQAPPPVDVEQLVEKKLQSYAQQAAARKAQAERAQFAQQHEFFDDLQVEIDAIMQAAKARGVAMTLGDAYNRAIGMNPEIAAIVKQRQAKETAANVQASTQRAKAAAGVKPSPAVPVVPRKKQMSDYEAVEAAIDALSGR